ncbi:MAG: recombinase family protein, partial [Dehalococcoidia bacterium]
MTKQQTKQEQPERVAIYCRVSTDAQEERQTIQSQIKDCREHCERKGYEIADEFLDDGVTGASPFEDRPEGGRLLSMLDADKPFTRTIVYCVDRLARDNVEGQTAYKRLRRMGAPVEFVRESFDGTPSGKFQFDVFIAVAEYERAMIRERTMKGRARRVDNGRYTCSIAPYGYTYEDGALTIDPIQAGVVREMFGWCVGGAGLKEIAQRLNDQDVPPPSPAHPKRQSQHGWHFSTVYKMLRHPRYMGEGSYTNNKPKNGQTTDGQPSRRITVACPAIVSAKTFSAAQRGLSRRRNQSPRNARHFYLLQQLIYCRHCGSRYLSRTTIRGKTNYTCAYRHRYGSKVGHEGVRYSYAASVLDPAVKNTVRDLYFKPETMLAGLELDVQDARQRIEGATDKAAFLDNQLRALQGEEKATLRQARKGIITDRQLKDALDEVAAERAALQPQITEARKAVDDKAVLLEALD